MGYFRFRRSLLVLPGLRLNIGKRGASVSLGGRGAHVTIGKSGLRETVGLPDSTGLSYTHLEKPHHAAANAPGAAHSVEHANVPPAYQPPSAVAATLRVLHVRWIRTVDV
jgi:hypothetical protein